MWFLDSAVMPWCLSWWLFPSLCSELFSVFLDVHRNAEKALRVEFESSLAEQSPEKQLSASASQESASLFDFFSLAHLPSPRTSLPPPSHVTSDPTLILPFSPFAKNFLDEAIPGCFSMEYPYPPPAPLRQASSSGPRSLYQLFVRDLPPQSHKSTEDRCLLCLIKALPPGVIPQFEQEEKPSEGGNVLDQSYEGPILYTLI